MREEENVFTHDELVNSLNCSTQSRLTARRSDTTAARLAEVGRRWCHCLYAPEGCVLAMERKGKQGSRRA